MVKRKVLYLSIQDLKDLGLLKKYKRRKYKKRLYKYLQNNINNNIKSQSNMGYGYTQQEAPRFTNTSNLNSENTRLNNLLIENQINKNKNDNNSNNDNITNDDKNDKLAIQHHNNMTQMNYYLQHDFERRQKINYDDDEDNIDVNETEGSNNFNNTSKDKINPVITPIQDISIDENLDDNTIINNNLENQNLETIPEEIDETLNEPVIKKTNNKRPPEELKKIRDDYSNILKGHATETEIQNDKTSVTRIKQLYDSKFNGYVSKYISLCKELNISINDYLISTHNRLDSKEDRLTKIRKEMKKLEKKKSN